MAATESALGWAVPPRAPAGADGDTAGLGLVTGGAVGGVTGGAVGGGTTATGGRGDGDSGPAVGIAAGLNDSWVPAPSRWNWKTLTATTAPITNTRNSAGKR